MRLVEGLKIRKVAGQTLLVPVGKTAKKIRQTAVLNTDAAYFVSLMVGEFTKEDIVNQCLKTYQQVNEEVLRRDVDKIVDTMKLAGMIIDDDDPVVVENTENTVNVTEDENGTKTISGTVQF